MNYNDAILQLRSLSAKSYLELPSLEALAKQISGGLMDTPQKKSDAMLEVRLARFRIEALIQTLQRIESKLSGQQDGNQ